MDLPGLLRASASRLPEKVAFTAGDQQLTYAELDRAVDEVAIGLRKLGVSPGDRVAIGMHNVMHFPIAYFGILRAAAAAVPLNVMLTAEEVGRVIADSGAKVVLGAAPFIDIVRQGVPEEVTIIGTDQWDRLDGKGEAFDPEIDQEDLAVLAYTSGTTGEPKGAMLSHGNLVANLRQQMEIPDSHVTESDVMFLALPLFHIFGLNVGLGLLVMNGASGVLVERFEPVPTLRLIADHRITILFGAPTMFSAWVSVPGADQYDVSSVRLAISGAAPLGPDVLRDFRDLFGIPIFEGYGLTETAPTLMSNRMTDAPRAGSIGKPLPDVEYRLLNDEDNDVELGDPGEIVVKGPNVFKGYWQRPEDTKRAFVDGGWFRTGDVAVADEEGYVYIVDRKRDLIIVSGFNVFPSEVEAALVASPKIAEAAVVGIPHPYTGESVKAYVVLEPGTTATEQELIEDAQDRVARFKAPTSIDIVEDLPHLPTGKVLRRALRI